MSKIFQELASDDRLNVLVSNISEPLIKAMSGVDMTFFVANKNQESNKEVYKDTGNILLFPNGDIFPHILYNMVVGFADDPSMIEILENVANVLNIPFVLFIDKTASSYGSVRLVNLVKRCGSDLNVFTSNVIRHSWNIKDKEYIVANYYDSDQLAKTLTTVEQECKK